MTDSERNDQARKRAARLISILGIQKLLALCAHGSVQHGDDGAFVECALWVPQNLAWAIDMNYDNAGAMIAAGHYQPMPEGELRIRFADIPVRTDPTMPKNEIRFDQQNRDLYEDGKKPLPVTLAYFNDPKENTPEQEDRRRRALYPDHMRLHDLYVARMQERSCSDGPYWHAIENLRLLDMQIHDLDALPIAPVRDTRPLHVVRQQCLDLMALLSEKNVEISDLRAKLEVLLRTSQGSFLGTQG